MNLIQDPRTALDHAATLQSRARQAGRWLATFEACFGVASLGLAVGFGLLPVRLAMVTLLPVWLLIVVSLSVYAARQRAWFRGASRIHGIVMALWAVTWGITVAFGSGPLAGQFWPWLVGGLVMLGICLSGAWWILRRTAP